MLSATLSLITGTRTTVSSYGTTCWRIRGETKVSLTIITNIFTVLVGRVCSVECFPLRSTSLNDRKSNVYTPLAYENFIPS